MRPACPSVPSVIIYVHRNYKKSAPSGWFFLMMKKLTKGNLLIRIKIIKTLQ